MTTTGVLPFVRGIDFTYNDFSVSNNILVGFSHTAGVGIRNTYFFFRMSPMVTHFCSIFGCRPPLAVAVSCSDIRAKGRKNKDSES